MASLRLSVMPEPSMSRLNSSKSLPSAAEVLREQPDFAKFDADLADLAARFAAQSGGGLSPELSAELALEIVLHEIAEQACLATGATGAAIVLERDGEMVCRASSGSTTPKMGSRLDTSAGLSGECFKTRQTQWCDDTKSDPRVDADVSDRLGVRSVVVMPLLRGSDVVGVIELFSSRPYAFGARDERTLEVLADRTLNNLEHAAHPSNLENKPEESIREQLAPEPEQALEQTQPEEEPYVPVSQPRSLEAPVASQEQKGTFAALYGLAASSWMLGAVALVCAALLGLVLGWQFGTHGADPPAHSDLIAPTTEVLAAPPAPAKDANKRSAPPSAQPSTPAAKPSVDRVPPGGLLVFENGKEVFRMPPNPSATANQAGGMQPASAVEPDSVAPMSPTAAEGSLLRRVEPQYPEAAREQNIQGRVVLEAHIGASGEVQEVQLVSGPPLLVQAATVAVRQWKFKPRFVNGKPVEMQTRITLNFRLPQDELLPSPRKP